MTVGCISLGPLSRGLELLEGLVPQGEEDMKRSGGITRLCVGLMCALCSVAQAADTVINGAVGAIYGTGGAPEANAGWVGGWNNGAGFISVGVHNISGLTVATVPQAILRIPEQDNGGGGDAAAYNANALYLYHIDAISDTGPSTGDDGTAALGLIGLYRSPGPTNQDLTRYVQFDVTDLVHANILAGRASLGWRIQHDAAASYSGYRRYSTTGANIPVLIIKQPGTVETDCNDGIDNDGDTLIDCMDVDCTDRIEGGVPTCPEDCDNAVDDDADGLVDCNDSECASSPACPEVLCSDGLDNDGDGNSDCNDPDCCSNAACANIEPCVEVNCGDNLDGDGDGNTDCADSDCAGTFACGGGELCIKPAPPQDAHVYAALNVVEQSTAGLWGKYGGQGLNFVTIHSLPQGITSADVGSASLTIARTDNAWSSDISALDLRMLLQHIDAADDSVVTGADGTSAPLDEIGLYREPGPNIVNNSRSLTFNVGALVKADLDAGRTSFAHRIEPESVPDGASSQRYIPTVENTDGAFPLLIRGATLCLRSPGLSELDSCTDGIDNDNDGLIDCRDPECTNESNCPEICKNGVDDDADGLVDCDDDECLSDLGCPEGLCADNVDNDNDGQKDCADSDCFGAVGCQSEAGYCGDSADNDNDCLTDAADPDCGGTKTVYPASKQDGAVASSGQYIDNTGPFGIWGSLDTTNQIQIVQAGIHTLPAIANPANVVSAELRVPATVIIWTVGGYAILDVNADVLHIDANDDTILTAADGNSASLANLGRYRNAGDFQPAYSAYKSLDVTAAVQADVTAGRTSFAWRFNIPDTLPLGTGGENNPQVYFPTVDNGDGAFPATNRGARLLLKIAGQFENICDDGTDNDGDQAIDCADVDCFNDPVCNVAGEASCADGMDNDGNNLTDCEDPICILNPCCAAPVEFCTNGVDDNANGLIDCEDPECRCAPNCGPWSAEACGNSIDDDCDGDNDCADSDCTAHPACLDCLDPFADLDLDGDVDSTDFARWQRCVTVNGAPVATGCECLDRDGDHVIDIDDLDAFVFCASGPNVMADKNCDALPQ